MTLDKNELIKKLTNGCIRDWNSFVDHVELLLDEMHQRGIYHRNNSSLVSDVIAPDHLDMAAEDMSILSDLFGIARQEVFKTRGDLERAFEPEQTEQKLKRQIRDAELAEAKEIKRAGGEEDYIKTMFK